MKNKRKLISIVLSMCLIFAQLTPVFADEATTNQELEQKQTSVLEENLDSEQNDDQKQNDDQIQNQNQDLGEGLANEDESLASGDISGSKDSGIVMSKELQLADGIYKPDDFSFSGGTGKVTITCPQVTIINGKAKARIVFSSSKYSKLQLGTKIYSSVISDEKAVFDDVVVELNKPVSITGTTLAMSSEKQIDYTINITLSTSSEKISGTTVNPDSSEEPAGPTEDAKPENGTYKVKTTTDNKMFKLDESVDGRSILKITSSGMTATITLSGTGYDYLYPGTAEEAANASSDKLCGFSENNGLYSYTVPVSKLNEALPFASHSIKNDKWYDRAITFSTEDIIKIDDGTPVAPSNPSAGGNSGAATDDQTSDVSNSWKDDSGKGTVALDTSTKLKDGTYKPLGFSWSGGTGRLSYIKCNKVMVKNGQALAVIEFGSSSYDQLKANGRIYSNSNKGGLSTFVIPVKLNANNTIIGRTTAMSEAHWIEYSIYISLPVNEDGTVDKAKGKAKTDKLSKNAPEITGLQYESTVKIEEAEYFKIFNYNDGITLLQIDVATDTALKKENDKKAADTDKKENGKKTAKTQHDITMELYQNNVVNYLIVPEGTELPAGLEKEYVIIEKPVESTFIGAKKAEKLFAEMDIEDFITGKADKGIEKIDYKSIVENETDLCILSADVLPEKDSADKDKKEELLRNVQTRFTALDIPVIIMRSSDEESKLAKSEWIKVYGAIYGLQEEADAIFEGYKKK